MPGAAPGTGSDNSASSRKLEHVELALSSAVATTSAAGWDDVRLVPSAIPELSLADIDVSNNFLGRPVDAPIVLAPMTGGHDDLGLINARLGEAAQQLGLVVGVGSQRAALTDPSLAGSFAAVRHGAPDAVVLANVGAGQLVDQTSGDALGAAQLQVVIDMVRADALTVHLNVAQELVQTEGDRITSSFLPALEAAVRSSSVPVIVKETGGGMTADDARRLAAVGVAMIDVGGAGGTSFVEIEGRRSERAGDDRGARLGTTFRGWGVPTAASILETRAAGLPIIATGGVRNGLDAAKAVALGANWVGVGRLAMAAAQRGGDVLVHELGLLIEELRMALLLCGSPTLDHLRSRSPVLTGDTLEWTRQRGLVD